MSVDLHINGSVADIKEIVRVICSCQTDIDVHAHPMPEKEPMELKQQRILPEQVAELLGKSSEWVRESMRQGTIDIGTCTQMPGRSRDSFQIVPNKLRAYVGDDAMDAFERENGL